MVQFCLCAAYPADAVWLEYMTAWLVMHASCKATYGLSWLWYQQGLPWACPNDILPT